MAASSKTFIPDSTWGFSGDVSLSLGSLALLTANLTYDADTGGSDIDLSAHSDGTSLTTLGWTLVTGTSITVETVSGTKVIQLLGSWGGAHPTTPTVLNGGTFIKMRGGGRWNPFIRWTSGVQSGYVTQLASNEMIASEKLGSSLVSFFDGSRNVTEVSPVSSDIKPTTGLLNYQTVYTEADGKVRHIAYVGTHKWADRIDDDRRYGSGLFGLQSFGTLQVDFFKVYTMATGVATTPVLTPVSVTTWGEISAALEGVAETMQTDKLSEIFTYKMIGGTPSPSVHTAVPDDGDISAATGDSIEIKWNPDNRYASHLSAKLNSISVSLNDGQWDTPTVTVPGEPTALTLVSQDATDVSLSWTNGANTTALEIMRATISSAGVTGAFAKINDATVTGTTYTDNIANSTPDPVTGTSYAYAIKPLNGTIAGDWSNTVIATFVTAVSRIPGDIEADLSQEFIQTADFGEAVIYTPFGGSPVTINAMYDAESTTVDPDTNDIRTSNPLITVATKDAETASNRDTFTISGQVFRVREVMPDGSGLTVIELTKDK